MYVIYLLHNAVTDRVMNPRSGAEENGWTLKSSGGLSGRRLLQRVSKCE